MNQDERQAIARTVTGFFQELGAQLEEYSEGRAVVGLTLTEKHMNNASSLHGGVTASLIDIAMGLCGTWAASPAERRVAITLSPPAVRLAIRCLWPVVICWIRTTN